MRALPAIASAIVLTLPVPAEPSASGATEADAFDELPAAGSGGTEMLDEMVVESSKLDETFAQTSTSIGRVDAKRIEDSQLRNVNDAYRMLGNVRAPQFVDGGFVIRGVNSESPDAENISGDQAPLSTIFVDGVAMTQQGARRGPLGLWDVQSVEVLRGPQSTLQGKNALAGSVNIVTKDPVFEWQGASRFTIGDYGSREWAAMLNVPISDAVALRFTAEQAESRTFVRYPGLVGFPDYDDFRTSDSLQLRGKLLVAPTGPFSSKLTWSYAESSPALGDVFGPAADPRAFSFHDHLWLTSSPNQQVRSTRNHSAAWENRYEISETLRLTALTTYTRTALAVDEIDGGKVRNDLEQEATQEVRLNWDDTWGKAVLGIYGSRGETESTQVNIERTRENAALFGEADVVVREPWHLIGGGRLFHEDYHFSTTSNATASEETTFLPKAGVRYEFRDDHTLGFTFQRGYQSGGSGIDSDGTPFEFDPSSTWHYELAWRNTFLDQRLIVSANAFYSDWKDQQVVLRTIDSTTFNVSERVINAAESTMYGGELEITAIPAECVRVFGSVGLLSTRYDDFTYQIDPTIAAMLGVPDTLDYRGYEFPEAPALNFSIGFDWRPGNGFFVAADAAYTSSYYSPVLFAPLGSGTGAVSVQVPQNDVVKVDPYVTVNLSTGYEAESWKLTFFVNNLFNEEYVVGKTPGAVNTASGIQFTDHFLATAGAPRTCGAAVEFRF